MSINHVWCHHCQVIHLSSEWNSHWFFNTLYCHQTKIPSAFSNTLYCALCIFIRMENSHWFVNTLYCHQTENFLNTSFSACTVRCQWRRPVLSHLQCTMCWPRFSKMTDVSSSHLPVVPKDDRCLGSAGFILPYFPLFPLGLDRHLLCMYLDFSVIAEFLSFILGDQAFLGAHTISIYSKCWKKTNVFFSHKKSVFCYK